MIRVSLWPKASYLRLGVNGWTDLPIQPPYTLKPGTITTRLTFHSCVTP